MEGEHHLSFRHRVKNLSTTDLLPKSRTQARRRRQQLARSKLNLIARQLYELKYDHQWQERQLQSLVQDGETLELKAKESMGRVIQAEEIVAAIVANDMELKLEKVQGQGLVSLGKLGGFGSERSTEPEGQHCEALIWREEGGWGCETDISVSSAEQTSYLEIIKTPTKNEKQSCGQNPVRRSSLLKPFSAKRVKNKQRMASVPIGNIVLFCALLVVVLALL